MNYKYINNIKTLWFNSFPDENLFHFSTTIEGGVSRGDYKSFNLGFSSGDIRENVVENRKRLAQMADISPENLFVPYQTHDDKICVIDKEFLCLSEEEKLEKLNGIDALITNEKNIGIAITTADCVPILIFDPKQKVLAAIHAGWKGTVSQIAAKTALKMIERFDCEPHNLLGGIAPSISQDCFEVGDEVVDAFIQAGFSINEIAYKNAATEKMHINLQLANKIILNEIGISSQNIETSQLCTFSHPDKFFSARRQTIASGRMLTGGVIR